MRTRSRTRTSAVPKRVIFAESFTKPHVFYRKTNSLILPVPVPVPYPCKLQPGRVLLLLAVYALIAPARG